VTPLTNVHRGVHCVEGAGASAGHGELWHRGLQHAGLGHALVWGLRGLVVELARRRGVTWPGDVVATSALCAVATSWP
jgi:hypothetical protein